jgi:hypothetical protein
MKEAVFNLLVLAISSLITAMTYTLYQGFWNAVA